MNNPSGEESRLFEELAKTKGPMDPDAQGWERLPLHPGIDASDLHAPGADEERIRRARALIPGYDPDEDLSEHLGDEEDAYTRDAKGQFATGGAAPHEVQPDELID